jgi:hypothetical protein
MQSSLVFLCFIASQALCNAESNPLGTVFSLMDELTAKITAQGEKEAKAYKEYVEWCDDAAANVKYDIKSAKSKKEELEASIVKSTDDATASASQIEDLASAIAADSSELKQATTIREKESADFAASEAELVESVDTLGRAISIIGREMSKNPALMQQVNSGNMGKLLTSLSTVVDAAAFSVSDRDHLMALVQNRQKAADEEDDSELGAPAPASYKSHSSNIMDVLEDLKEKAEEELADLRKAESATKHNYLMLKQSLDDQMAADTKDLNEQKTAKAAADEAKATAVGDLAETTKSLANSEEVLETTGTTCMTVAADHEATVKSRAEELKAIATAKKILKESSSGAESQTYSLLQLVEQTHSSLHTRADLANAEIVNLLKKLARQQHSSALAQLASRIAAVVRYGATSGEDPFQKVKSLIKDMIVKLEGEAQSEATEKSYCDEEMAKSKAKKEELDYTISKLTAKIDKAAAHSASLKDEVKTLQAELAKLSKSQSEMDKMRSEERANYMEAKQELELGLSGVRKALNVLRDYYASSSSSALLQDGADIAAAMTQPAMPEKHSKAGGAGGSIIEILSVVESDFAQNLATEETQEADAVAEYEKTTQENKITKTLKEQDVTYKTKEFKGLDKDVAQLSSDRETSSTELSAVMDYYSKIKERCIAKPETYEARKKRREAEVAGLKEALSILNGEALVQRRKRGTRGHFLRISSL